MATGGEVPGRLPGSTGLELLSQRICQPCLEKDYIIDATGLCVDCQDYLCLKCFDDHTVQQHQVLDRENIQHGQALLNPEVSHSDPCIVHENEVIQYYCTSHCHLVCKSCIKSDHATCEEVHYIPHVSKELVNNEDYRKVWNHLNSVLDKFMSVFRNVQRQSDELGKSCADTLRGLCDFKRQMDEVLGNLERELVRKVQTLRLKAEQELVQMRHKYKAAHKELQSSLAKIEVLQNADQNCSSYIEMMRTNEKIKSLEDQIQQSAVDISYRQSPIQFTPNTELLDSLQSPRGFGTVSFVGIRNVIPGVIEVPVVSDTGSSFSDDFTVLSNETVSSFSDDFSVITDTGSRISQPSLRAGNIQSWLRTVSNLPGSETGSTSPRSAFETRDCHIKDLQVKTRSDKLHCSIIGMVVLPDSRLVLIDSSNASIKTVDEQSGEVVAQLWLKPGPWDITLIENYKVAVTIPVKHKIAFVTVGDYNLITDRTQTVSGECLGVDYRNGKLAVSFTGPYKVQIINLQGRVLHSISHDWSGVALSNFPCYLTFGQDDTTLYVSNLGGNNLVCVKTDGTVLATYRDRDLRGPRKAIVDNSGNVYVCAQDSNTIHQITKDSKELQMLLAQSDGLQWPYSLCLSEEEDKLYVGMWDNDCVKVYRTMNNESQ